MAFLDAAVLGHSNPISGRSLPIVVDVQLLEGQTVQEATALCEAVLLTVRAPIILGYRLVSVDESGHTVSHGFVRNRIPPE